MLSAQHLGIAFVSYGLASYSFGGVVTRSSRCPTELLRARGALYENRIHRRCERNRAELGRLQSELKAALEAAVAEAAEYDRPPACRSGSEAYDITEPFVRRNFEFSDFEIARMIDRHRRLVEAKRFVLSSKMAQRRAA